MPASCHLQSKLKLAQDSFWSNMYRMCQFSFFFFQNLLFMAQAFRKYKNNIRGYHAQFFRKWVRCTRVKVIRVEVSQNVVHARTTGWMTSTRPGKLRDFGLPPRRSNPRSRNLFWALGVESTWFLNFGGQAKCKLVLVVDSWPSLVVFGVVIPLWVKKHE